MTKALTNTVTCNIAFNNTLPAAHEGKIDGNGYATEDQAHRSSTDCKWENDWNCGTGPATEGCRSLQTVRPGFMNDI